LVGPLLVTYLVVVALVWAFQRRLLYIAAGRADGDAPSGVRHATYVAADGATVHTYELDVVGATRTVVYFHGNGEVIGDDVGMARELARLGLSVVLVEYRGYGHAAGGAPTEAGLYADAEAPLRALAARGVDASHVVLWGQSLGTGVAAEMASRGLGGALVLVSPYTSMRDVAAKHFPWLPARLLTRDHFDTLDKAPSIHVPTVVLHGTDDEIVPFAMGEHVAGAIPGARLFRVEGGHHNDLFAGAGARRVEELVVALPGAHASRAPEVIHREHGRAGDEP
jgi:fermentation-respiration switch protein FrsA (DUF1100 family)